MISGYIVNGYVDDAIRVFWMRLDSAVGSGLISLYSNCGYVSMARAIFDNDKVSDRNVVVWNAIIRCYGTHGLAQEAVALFQQLVESGLRPAATRRPHLAKLAERNDECAERA
uniref:Pentatricopeptide repeat-containing protein n=1 Tax=Cajanus cajan TaxID=3821 RepID=A0A151SME2_CAJCA|nr:hypothetical protein KK1_002170 [Cajanus cajan]